MHPCPRMRATHYPLHPFEGWHRKIIGEASASAEASLILYCIRIGIGNFIATSAKITIFVVKPDYRFLNRLREWADRSLFSLSFIYHAKITPKIGIRKSASIENQPLADSLCCLTRIRTWTSRTKNCCATITP